MRPHEVRVGAPRDMLPPSERAGDTAPALLQRSDDDFLEAILEQLRSDGGRVALKGTLASARTRTPTQVLKLFQPMQRQFHVAVIEAWCDVPGTPRIDPARAEAAGMVVRRVRRDATGSWLEGWMRARGRLLGWGRVARLGGERAHPTSAKRLERHPISPSLDRELTSLALAREDALLDEHVIPMFLAPPDVCAQAGKTLFYGLVPTTSAEMADVAVDPAEALGDDFGPTSPSFTNHLVEPLRGTPTNFVLGGRMVHPDWFEAVEVGGGTKPTELPDADWLVLQTPDGASRMQRFILLLRQVAGEFDAFGESAASHNVFAELENILLVLAPRQGDDTPRIIGAGTFLRLASRILLEHEPQAPPLEMPVTWIALDDTARARLTATLWTALAARFAQMKGRPGRFDEPGAEYVLRAFVRLRPEGECPARTEWSAYSEPFVIAPWYEGSGAAPVQVLLPDATDRELLKSLRPNVAFVVPASLQQLLVSGKPKDMLQGKGSTGSGLGTSWICGFSIPLITICAFIVLNVFLSLFNLIFHWLPFIKVCVPFPNKSDR